MDGYNDLIPGRRYRVKTWEQMVQEYGTDFDGDICCPGPCFVRRMRRYCGEILTAKTSDTMHDVGFHWCLAMVVPVSQTYLMDWIDKNGTLKGGFYDER